MVLMMIVLLKIVAPPPNSNVEALISSVTVFWDKAFKNVYKVKWCHRLKPESKGLLSL